MNGHQRLVSQSKEWLIEALFKLMENKEYEVISVTEIADMADLSRRTFYRSFKDKNDLLYYYIDNLSDEYLQSLNQLNGKNLGFEAIIECFLKFWWDHRDRAQMLIKQNLFSIVLQRMSKESNRLYDLFEAPWHIEGTNKEIKYVLTFFLGGLWNVLEVWLGSSNPADYRSLSRILMRSMTSIGNMGMF